MMSPAPAFPPTAKNGSVGSEERPFTGPKLVVDGLTSGGGPGGGTEPLVHDAYLPRLAARRESQKRDLVVKGRTTLLMNAYTTSQRAPEGAREAWVMTNT
jgi:hypothetical protein